MRPLCLAKRPGTRDFVYFVKKQQKSAVEDEKHVLGTVLGLAHLEKNYIIALTICVQTLMIYGIMINLIIF